MLIVESLVDKRRQPVYLRNRIVSLGDIAMYTDADEVPLRQVLNSIKAKQGGKVVAGDLKAMTNDELYAFLGEVLPEFDRDRVHPTDVRKLISWYNLLIESGITDFDEEEEGENNKEEEA